MRIRLQPSPKPLGAAEDAGADEANEKAPKEFKVIANKLIAARRLMTRPQRRSHTRPSAA